MIHYIYLQKQIFTVNSQEILAKRAWYLIMEESKKIYGESKVSFSENISPKKNWVENQHFFYLRARTVQVPSLFISHAERQAKI